MSVNKNLLCRYFSGNVTPAERQRIVEWLREESNLESYYQTLEEWELEHLQFETQTDAALQRYLSPVENTADEADTEQKPLKATHRLSAVQWLRWTAAAVLVLVSISTYLLRDSLLYQTYSTGNGKLLSIRLDDGSRVTLNANSQLRIPRWQTVDREVLLEGEAEFSVVHTRDHRRFLVKTDDQLQVEVLGTEFVVYSRKRGSKVALLKGKVRLSSLKNSHTTSLTIAPGDVVTVDSKGTFDLKSRQELTKHTAWRDHLFVFEHTSLQEITAQIEEIFGLSIQIRDPELAQRELTGAFEARTGDELLQALTKVMNLKLLQTGDDIALEAIRPANPAQ